MKKQFSFSILLVLLCGCVALYKQTPNPVRTAVVRTSDDINPCGPEGCPPVTNYPTPVDFHPRFGSNDFYISGFSAERVINQLGNPAVHTVITINGLTVGSTNLIQASLNLSDTNGFSSPYSGYGVLVATSSVQTIEFTKAQVFYQGDVFLRIKRQP